MSMNNPRLAYRQAAVLSATSVDLVIMLFDMLIEDLRSAIDALQANDVEKRCEELKHGILVLQQLQNSVDVENGGSAAESLNRFYTLVRAKLMEAHIKSSLDLMGEQIRLLLEVKEAWEKLAKAKSQHAEVNVPAVVIPTQQEQAAENSWSA